MDYRHRLFQPIFRSDICHYPLRTVVARLAVETVALVSLTAAGLFGFAQFSTPHAQASAAPSATSGRVQTVSPVAEPVTTAPLNVPPAAPTATPSPVLACAKPAFAKPSPLAISTTSPGLSQVIDAPQYYRVYGRTSDDIRSQINACSPVNEAGQTFSASTNYALNWQYDYVFESNACRTRNVAVGVHVSFVYPLWEPVAGTNANLTNKWQAFMADLTTHEQGHSALNIQYAQAILGKLQNLTTTDCSSMVATATAMVNADIAALNQANGSYDSTTNHGATQGAILP